MGEGPGAGDAGGGARGRLADRVVRPSGVLKGKGSCAGRKVSDIRKHRCKVRDDVRLEVCKSPRALPEHVDCDCINLLSTWLLSI